MADRLILPILNACTACLRESVVDDADTLDAAMIFATGLHPTHFSAKTIKAESGISEAME